MYATESSTRDGNDNTPLGLVDDSSGGVMDSCSSNERSWTSRVEGEDEGGRGGATTVESPFKDPHNLQPTPAQTLTRLPSFATLTFPLNRNGTPATNPGQTNNNEGTPNAHAGPSQSSPTGSTFSANTHFNQAAAQQIAQSSNYGNYYAAVDTTDPGHESNLLIDTSGLGPYDQPAPGTELDLAGLIAAREGELAGQEETSGDGANAVGGMNPSLKRARGQDDDREGSAGSSNGGGSGSDPKSAKPVTTQKTRDAGMTRRKVEARFSCPVEGCGSTFTRSGHTPHCTLEIKGCKLILFHSFYRSHNLSGHLRSHADERPFKCDVCGRGFARSVDAHPVSSPRRDVSILTSVPSLDAQTTRLQAARSTARARKGQLVRVPRVQQKVCQVGWPRSASSVMPVHLSESDLPTALTPSYWLRACRDEDGRWQGMSPSERGCRRERSVRDGQWSGSFELPHA